MRLAVAAIVSLTFPIISCSGNYSPQHFDLQGHRGARGLLPENTIPGFLHAVDLSVDTIELDVVVTSDQKILVSHEPWFHHAISSKPDGAPVTEEEERELNIYEMTYKETRAFDVGKRGHPSFPRQSSAEAQKPLLRDAIQAVENFIKEQDLSPVKYNIEIKSDPEYYGTFVPHPREFAKLLNSLLMELDQEFGLQNRIIIQSFDPAPLVEFQKVNPDIKLAMLVSNYRSIQSYLDTLGFTPDIWSPNYQLVTSGMIDKAHNKGMKVIPWTVNTTGEMRTMIEMGVDGIITDYPDSAAVLR